MKRLICIFIVLLISIPCLFACSTEQKDICLVDCSINEAGDLIASYSDGSTKNLGHVVGTNGLNGKDGIDGIDGSNGQTPYIKNGYWFIGSQNTGVKAQGPKGDTGATGATGQNGQDGKDGEIVEVIVPKYVEKSQVNLNGLSAIQLSDSVYEVTLKASDYSSKATTFDKIFTSNNIYVNNPSGVPVFYRGSLTTKPGYIIKELSLICTTKMAPATLFDEDYNVLNSEDIGTYASGYKFEYTKLNHEQITITFNHKESGFNDYYGAELIKIVFEVRN